jgi:hypothetical protein
MSELEFIRKGERYEVRKDSALLGVVWREVRPRGTSLRVRGHRTTVWRWQRADMGEPHFLTFDSRHAAAQDMAGWAMPRKRALP